MGVIKVFVYLAVGLLVESSVMSTTVSGQDGSDKPCTEQLIERLRTTLLDKGAQRWADSFKGQNHLSVYDSTEVNTNGVTGWLVTAGCSTSRGTVLVWISNSEVPKVDAPLVSLGEVWWDFLSVEKIGDFDRNGTIEALLVATGGAGMYYHYPILLRLGSDGHWNVLFAAAHSFFYGNTEVLSPTPDGRIRIAVTSVDEDAPWAFAQCTLCPHPYKREEFSVVNAGLDLVKKTPISNPISTVSNLILAARQHRFDAAYRLFGNRASINGVIVASPEIGRALINSRLTDVNGDCYDIHDDTKEGQLSTQTVQGKKIVTFGSPGEERDTVRFRCPVGKIDAEYTAQVARDRNGYRIHSLKLVQMIKD